MHPIYVKMLTSRSHILVVECKTSEEAQLVSAWAKKNAMENIKIQSTLPLSTKSTFVTHTPFHDLPENWKHEITEGN